MKRLIGIEIGFRKVGYLVVRLLLGNMTSCRCSCSSLLLGRRVEESKTSGEEDRGGRDFEVIVFVPESILLLYYLLSTIYYLTQSLILDSSKQD